MMRLKLRFNYSRRAGILILSLLFGICLFRFSRTFMSNVSKGSNFKGDDLSHYRKSDQDSRCKKFPDPGNIAIAVKTGATEAAEKIPTQMLTSLSCAQNVMIFSDLEQSIAGYQLHDALDTILRSDIRANPDFDFYFKLKEAARLGQIEKMKGTRDPRQSGDLAAWTLDKYKQLHILEKLYAKHPDKQWYLLIDADTYLVWSNLLIWLRKLGNPSKKMYLGSPARFGNIRFAHGGSGILMSHATMYDFAVTHNGTAMKWDRIMERQCCGDLVMGLIFKKSDIILKPAWPTINGENRMTLPFGEDTWCQPVVTMHHVDSNEMDQMMNFEESRIDLHVSTVSKELLLLPHTNCNIETT
jgi:hypothetical protein